MFSSLPPSLILFLAATEAFASPRPVTQPGVTIGLKRRSPKTEIDWGQWAKSQREGLQAKYGGATNQKRSSGMNLLVNQQFDSSFYGSLAIGTPAVSYNVILDTGSADLWIADSDCSTGCETLTPSTLFDASASSTFQNTSNAFSITYGSGAAAGSLAQDVVQMAGFSVSGQTFAVCDQVSSGLLSDPVSGLLGLAFETIASSGATPFWEQLVKSGSWDDPVMAFQLTRYIDDAQAETLEPGGTFTMGAVNSSLYTGEIEFVNIPGGQGTYWIQELTSLTVQGNSVPLTSGTSSYAAIDTGTTLVGGPANAIAEIYANIDGATAGTGNYEGYYIYPCDTSVNITMAFGGKNWAINSADMQVSQLSRTECLGAFFELSSGSSSPSWIVGDTFLKNVYSVFRYDPPSVGFAQLSETALAMNGADANVPVATIGSVAAAVEATGAPRSGASNGSPSSSVSSLGWVLALITALTVTL